MTCPMCNADNPASARFCMACGGELVAGPGEAPAHTTQPLRTDRPKYEHLLETAFRSYERGQLPEAILAAEAALALEPDSSAGRSLLGIIYEKRGDLRRAIEQFEKVVELNPDSASDREKLEALRLRTVSLTSSVAKAKLTETVWQRIASPLILGILSGAIIFAILWAIVARGSGDRVAANGGREVTTTVRPGGAGAAPQLGDLRPRGQLPITSAPSGEGDAGEGAAMGTPAPTTRPDEHGGSAWSGGTPPGSGSPFTSSGPVLSDLIAVKPPSPPPAAASGKKKPGTSPRSENQISLVIEEMNPNVAPKPNVEVIVPGGGTPASGHEGSTGGGGYSAGQQEHRGELYHLSGLYKEALDSYQKAFSQAPSWDLAQRMGMCYERLGQKQSAIDYYRRARIMAQSDIEQGRRVEEARQAIRSISSALDILGGE